VLSLKCPSALKSSVVATAMVCACGLTEMDTIVAFVTVNGVDPVTDPSVALMVVVPGIRPLDIPPLTICTTAVLEDAQVTCRVRF
jgi:hypothetical protein